MAIDNSSMSNKEWRTMEPTKAERPLIIEIEDRLSSESWMQGLVKAGLISDDQNIRHISIYIPHDSIPTLTVEHIPTPCKKTPIPEKEANDKPGRPPTPPTPPPKH
jgi:hypothetical protein